MEVRKKKKRSRDRKDRENNRLTSLHLIGSSCNHKQKMTDDRKQSEKGEKTQDSHT